MKWAGTPTTFSRSCSRQLCRRTTVLAWCSTTWSGRRRTTASCTKPSRVEVSTRRPAGSLWKKSRHHISFNQEGAVMHNESLSDRIVDGTAEEVNLNGSKPALGVDVTMSPL